MSKLSQLLRATASFSRRLANKAFPDQAQRREFWTWSGEDQLRLNFYRQFIAPGEVVYDIGANLGNRAKIFHKLGAVVIAVEPQRKCADYLKSVFKKKPNFHLVRKALGPAPGEAEMFICTAHTMSSLATNWLQAVKKSGRFGKETWDRTETVPVDTLDNLIAQYGAPAFVKIDVEGFEEQVLAGLTSPVGSLSLEFTPEYLEGAFRCIDYLCSLGNPRFQLSVGESMELAGADWVVRDEIKRRLAAIPRKEFGDLYARFDKGEARRAAA